MKFFPLSLFLLLFAAPMADAADVPEECRGTSLLEAHYGSVLSGSRYLKTCQEIVQEFVAIASKVKNEKIQMPNVAPSGAGGQAAGFEDAASWGVAGVVVMEAKLKVLIDAWNRSAGIARLAEAKEKELGNRAANSGNADFKTLAGGSKDEFARLKGIALQWANFFNQSRISVRNSADALAADAGRNSELAQSLRTRETPAPASNGVSKGTWVALGGAAVIAAGTVGGLYWVTTKAIDKADRAAEARIRQAEETATRVMDDAEGRVRRIVELAEGSVDRVMKNLETTARRIVEEAQNGADELTRKIKEDLTGELGKLTDTGLEKLRGEMDEMFAGLIDAARESGKANLADTLARSREDINEYLTQELTRRRNAVSSAISTGTSVDTGTAVGTSFSTGTATGTSADTNTATATATESSTTTGTTTSNPASGRIRDMTDVFAR